LHGKVSEAKGRWVRMDTLCVTRNILLDTGTAEGKRSEIKQYFNTTFTLYESLFETLKNKEAFYVRPEPLRHPHIFYFGHTATFYINKLNLAKVIDFRVNEVFESMFAIGVDEMSWDDLDPAHYEWPDVDLVIAYRNTIREVVNEVIDSIPLVLPIGWNDPMWIILMGIEHERIHLETSSVLIRQTSVQHLRHSSAWKRCEEDGEVPFNTLLSLPGGHVVMGKDITHNQYGWDNEYGNHEVHLESFSASQFLVSNGEFLEFVREGGYQNRKFWSDEGWQWLESSKAEHPVFWIVDSQGSYRYRTLLEEIDMPWSWPVDVNYLEAKAFCNWKSSKVGVALRLPTEEEWYRLREHSGIDDEPYWNQAPGNINLEHYASSCPVDRYSFKDGFCDVVGNVWQWTETPIARFEGFEVHPVYDDFSVPTFDGKHNLLKGGSWISTGNEANRHSRYAFRRHFYQHAGFRYVSSENSLRKDRAMRSNAGIYETDTLLAQYCEFHYGDLYFGVENFAKKSAEVCLSYMKGRKSERALDIGCGAGRSTFELARVFPCVHGIDFTARFIRLGIALQERGCFEYHLPVEGDIAHHKTIELHSLGLADCAQRVSFWQGDAGNLKAMFTGYDLIFAGNLIDRMRHPSQFLNTIHRRLNTGGVLVLATPCTWLEEFTDSAEWIGGYYRDGAPVTTFDGIKAILESHFILLDEPFEIPFVIRETQRKFQHSLSEFTVWQKK
jgi:5-histidylcysteine sulfoxide synthase/putative 4-mercaptohistidine N1-methyltranferase